MRLTGAVARMGGIVAWKTGQFSPIGQFFPSVIDERNLSE